MTIHYRETKYGFDYGAVTVERACSDDSKGWVTLSVKTKKLLLGIYVTKTGKIRIFDQKTHKEYEVKNDTTNY